MMTYKKNFKGIIIYLLLTVMFCVGCGKHAKDDADNITTTEEQTTESQTTEQAAVTGLELPRTTSLAELDLPLCANALEGVPGIYTLDGFAGEKDDVVVEIMAYSDTEILALYTGGKIYKIDLLKQEITAEGDVKVEYYPECIHIGNDGSILITAGFNNKVKVLDENLNTVKTIQLTTESNSAPKVTEDNKELFYVDYSTNDLCHTYVDGDKTTTVNMDIFDVPINSLEVQAVFPERDQVLLTMYYENGDSFPYLYNYELGVEAACDYPAMYWVEYDDEKYISRYSIEYQEEVVFGKIDEAPGEVFSFDKSIERYSSHPFMKEGKIVTFVDDAMGYKGKTRYEIRVYNMNGTLENYIDFTLKGDYECFHTPIIMEKLGIVVFISDGYGTKLYVADLIDERTAAKNKDNHIYSIDCTYGKNEVANADVRRRADELEKKYGIDIGYGDDYVQCIAGDYEIRPVYNTLTIKEGLDVLDEELSKYPDGMLAQIQKEKPLFICFSNNIFGTEESSLSAAGGYENSTPEYIYFVIDISDPNYMRSTIHHELFHAIEEYMGVNGWYFDYDQWMTYNPAGFEYAWDYTDYGDRDSSYVADVVNADEVKKEVSFIDTYSMSNCLEDHARIMEYAMREEDANTGYFDYDNIRNKLAYESEMLRQAFDTTGWPEVTEWEKLIAK